MRERRFIQADVFASEPTKGNGLARYGSLDTSSWCREKCISTMARYEVSFGSCLADCCGKWMFATNFDGSCQQQNFFLGMIAE